MLKIEQRFEQFKLEITVENKIDLEYLWLLFNLGANSLFTIYKDDPLKCDAVTYALRAGFFSSSNDSILSIVDKEMKKYLTTK